MPPRLVHRRAAGHRWLIIPLVLTMLVLLVDASMHARSPKPAVALSTAAWLDRILPRVTTSSAQGLEIARLSSSRLGQGSASAVTQLSQIATGARSTYRAVARDTPPQSLLGAAGLLLACLSSREKGAAQMASSVTSLVSKGTTAKRSALGGMSRAVADFSVSDNAYRLFVDQLPRLGVTMPASSWDLSQAHYGTKTYEAFAHRLLAGTGHHAGNALAIDAVSTDPTALSMQGKVQVLPPASSLAVTVVVADAGTAPEDGVTVAVSVKPGRRGSAGQRSTVVDLQPGLAQSVVLVGLALRPSTPTTLEVTAEPAHGQAGGASRSLDVEMAGTNFDEPTTTGGPTTTRGGKT